MTSACLHQPNAYPWAKLVDKILGCDVWIVYDTAQYTRTEFHSRQVVKGRQGPVWLTIPIVSAGRPRFQPLRDVEISRGSDWRAAHLRLLREHYLHAPYYDEVRDLIQPVFDQDHRWLVDFNVDVTATLLDYLGSRTRIVRASELAHDGDRTQRLIDLNRSAGCDTHVTSSWANPAIGLDWQRIADAGISVREQVFRDPIYPQLHGAFQPHLSVLDLLFNCGRDAAAYLPGRSCAPVMV
jgi:WbqC-like protein family